MPGTSFATMRSRTNRSKRRSTANEGANFGAHTVAGSGMLPPSPRTSLLNLRLLMDEVGRRPGWTHIQVKPPATGGLHSIHEDVGEPQGQLIAQLWLLFAQAQY